MTIQKAYFMKLSVLALTFLALLGACSSSQQSRGEDPSVRVGGCQPLLDTLVAHNQAMRTDVEDERRLIPQILSACELSFERNYQLASFYALRGKRTKVLEYLDPIASNDPVNEPRRLELLYWTHYASFSEFEQASRVVKDALERFPTNVHTRLITGVDTCLHGSCSSALEDLKAADKELHSIRGLAFLAYAYADSEDYAAAVDAFDLLQAGPGGIDTLDDLLVYVGVVSYVNVGRPSDARALLDAFRVAAPNYQETRNIQKAKAILESFGL